MRLDLTRINNRINKLQELKRMANDPELMELFLEFITQEEAQARAAEAAADAGAKREAPADDVVDAVQGVLDASGAARGVETGFGILTRRRA
jgi:hypothetical protein